MMAGISCIIILLIVLICPEKTFKSFAYREKWMNKDLMELIIDKDKALKKAKTTRKIDDWIIAKKIRNSTGKLIDMAKKNYFEDEYLASKGDPKRFWRNINSIIPNSKSKPSHINLINENKEDIDPDKVSDYINTFFTNIGPNLASKYSEKWRYYGLESDVIIEDVKFNKGDLLLLIDNIDISKSSGFQNVSSKCLKDALSVLVTQLLYIFTQSYKLGIFPKSWKKATTVPLFKGGVKENVSNYIDLSHYSQFKVN